MAKTLNSKTGITYTYCNTAFATSETDLKIRLWYKDGKSLFTCLRTEFISDSGDTCSRNTVDLDLTVYRRM